MMMIIDVEKRGRKRKKMKSIENTPFSQAQTSHH